jgi:hypothetical protein
MSRFELIGGIKKDGELMLLFPTVYEARKKLSIIRPELRKRCSVVVTTRGIHDRNQTIPFSKS